MQKTTLVWTLLLALTGAMHADDKTAWREKLETAIPEGIRMLEAKEYVPFLKAFIAPDQLKMILEQSTIEQFAEKFSERKAAGLLKVMKAIKDLKPVMDKNDTQATYEISIEGVSKKNITFNKIDKFWYIAN